jgi:cellulose synthase operon protein YhjQ
MTAIVAVASLKGGVGRTTLAANLGSALAQVGHRCAVMDLDPQNALSAHFGRPGVARGLADLHYEPGATERRNAIAGGDVTCVPFGRGEEAEAIADCLRADAAWLRRRIAAATPPGCEVVWLDTPAHHSPWLERALELADEVLVVVTPEPACFATLPAMEALLTRTRGSKPSGLYVVNRADAASGLRRDVGAALRETFGPRVAPIVVHEDETVREALAHQRTLFREESDSQALADVAQLGEWVTSLLGLGSGERLRVVGADG